MRSRRIEAGFTMIEVMVAILLTVIAVIGVVALFRIEAASSSFSRHSTEASTLAADGMEVLRTTSLPATGSETALDAQGQAGGIYDRAWTVVIGTTMIDYTVTVTWLEDGTSHSVTLFSKGSRP